MTNGIGSNLHMQSGVTASAGKRTSFWQRRVVQPLVGQLRQGTSPEKLAQSLAWGIMLGVFPILGTTMVLCGITATWLRLNHVAIQTVNWLVYPLQFLLIIPFLQLGNWLFGYERIVLTIDEISAHFNQAFWVAIRDFGWLAFRGIMAWMIIAVPLIFLMSRLFHRLLRRLPLPSDSMGAT